MSLGNDSQGTGVATETKYLQNIVVVKVLEIFPFLSLQLQPDFAIVNSSTAVFVKSIENPNKLVLNYGRKEFQNCFKIKFLKYGLKQFYLGA